MVSMGRRACATCGWQSSRAVPLREAELGAEWLQGYRSNNDGHVLYAIREPEHDSEGA